MHDATGLTAYTYTAASQPITVTLSTGEAIGYRYDPAGNRTHTIYPDGKTATTTYTPANQPAQVTDWDNGTTQYAYDGNGRPATVTLPNGVVTTAAYDDGGNLIALTHTKGGSTIGTYAYAYDPTGRRTNAIEDTRTITYTYDGLYRLADASESSGEQYQYTYDAAGNRLSKIEPGTVVTATYDAANQFLTLNGQPVAYDGNGNLLDDGTQTYAYDHLDRLIGTTRGITTTQFGYTGDGDRLWEATAGVTTTFTLDLNTALTQVLAQQGGGTTTRFLPGIGQEINGAWQYLHADALGNVRQVTDANGTVLGSRRYSPFGEVVAGSGSLSPLGFTGEPQDAASGLTYLRARYYNPALGRFLTPDSIVPDAANGQAWNAYAYVYNDVVNLVDPSGFAPTGPPTPVQPPSIDPLGEGALQTQSPAIRALAMIGRMTDQVGKWWNKKPNDCGCQAGNSDDGLGNLLNHIGASALINSLLAKATDPFIHEGKMTTIISKRTKMGNIRGPVGRFVAWLGGPRVGNVPSRHNNTIISKPYGQIKGWTLWRRDGIQPSLTNNLERTHLTGVQTRFNSHPFRGGIGATLGAGLIDGILQFAGDARLLPCLSPAQRAGRIGVAVGVGVASGLVGTAAFFGLAALGAPAIVTLAGSYAAGVVAGYALTPAKNQWLEQVTGSP